jgi:hypothetical protein
MNFEALIRNIVPDFLDVYCWTYIVILDFADRTHVHFKVIAQIRLISAWHQQEGGNSGLPPPPGLLNFWTEIKSEKLRR